MTSRRYIDVNCADATSQESTTMLVVHLEGCGDEPAWIATYVTVKLNVFNMNSAMYFRLVWCSQDLP